VRLPLDEGFQLAVHIKKGTTLSVVDQGGESHTFTEVANFGGVAS
jgi:hypothetical protein